MSVKYVKNNQICGLRSIQLQDFLKLEYCLNFDWLCSVQIMVDIVMYSKMLPFSTLEKQHEYFYLNQT